MLLVDVGPSVCCLSLGYISHTKQDRPIVTVEHYVEVNTADVFAALSLLHPGRYSGFKCWKICSDINMASCSTLASDRRCCQHGETVVTLWVLSAVCDHRNLLWTLIVRCVDNTFGMTQKLNKRWASFLSQWWYACYILCDKNSVPLRL